MSDFYWSCVLLVTVVLLTRTVGQDGRRAFYNNDADRNPDPESMFAGFEEDSNSVKVRQYFSDDCQRQLNDQIKYEFVASHIYLSMSTYLARWDVALPGFSKKFRAMSDEEREHGIKLMEYANKRGGIAKMPLSVDISEYQTQVESNHWGDIKTVLETALKTERLVNHRLVDYVRNCSQTQNYHMEHFIDDVYLTEQVDSIRELGQMITEIKMIGSSHVDNYGLYLYDKKLLNEN